MTIKETTCIYMFVLTYEDTCSHCRWKHSFCNSYEVRSFGIFKIVSLWRIFRVSGQQGGEG